MNLNARTERFRIAIFLLLALVVTFGQGALAAGRYLVYVGTYTDQGSKGIYAYQFDTGSGRLSSLGLAAESLEPSFLAISANGRFLYAANEIETFSGRPTGAVSAFAINPQSGKLSLLNQASSQDPGPAHVTLDRTGKYVLVSNYTLGSVAVFPVLADGRLGEACAFVRHKGSSVNPERQKGPHAHAFILSPDNRFAIVADLGLDELLAYPFDAANGTLGHPRIMKTRPGAGPRHLAFSPNGQFLYVINELQSTVVAYSYAAESGRVRELQTLSTLPKGFLSKNTAAEIEVHPSGKFLFASNRGDDSIAVFAIAPKRGTLKLLEIDPTGGKTPRNFALDPSGSWLLVGNQDSDDIVVFRVDPETAHLTPDGAKVPVPSPACIKFVPLP